MNLKNEYENSRIKSTKIRREQLNWCIENNIGLIRGKNYFLDGKCIFGVTELKDFDGYVIVNLHLDIGDELEYFWNKLPT